MSLAIRVVAEPAEEPLSLVQAKDQLRVTNDDSNELIASYIAAARRHLENTRGSAYVTQTRERQLDCFLDYCGVIEIPRSPLQSVTWIKYIDFVGVEQTLSPTLYQVDARSEPGRIAPAYGQAWPSTRPQLGAVTIRYVCGYVAAAAVPEEVRQAMRLLVTDAWECKSETVIGTIVATRKAVDALLPVIDALWIGR